MNERTITITENEVAQAVKLSQNILGEYKQHIVGQDVLMIKTLVALLADGHILLEGVPGLAKTRTVRVLSQIVSVDFKRIQFTPDLLPSDVIGTQVFNQKTQEFSTLKGPVFANLVLADEINRAPAKVQSALLEAMQERQVTIGGVTYPLPNPFFVIATENPIDQEGTFPLPEAQIDRFMVKLELSYPSPEAEREMLDIIEADVSDKVDAHLTAEDLIKLQKLTQKVYIDPALKAYIVRLVNATRFPTAVGLQKYEQIIEYGASPRASIALLQAAKAVALLYGRAYVIPEDVKYIAPDILRHRIIFSYEGEAQGISKDSIITELLATVPVS